MRPADQVWNRAAFASDPADWDPLGPGDRKLAALLALHGFVSNGTVLAAVEDLEAEELERGIEGFRYFGLGPVADLIASARLQREHIPDNAIDRLDELEIGLERAYGGLVPSDATLAVAFERVFEARPDEFAPLGVGEKPSPAPLKSPFRATTTLQIEIDPRFSVVEIRPHPREPWTRIRDGETRVLPSGVYWARADGRSTPGFSCEPGTTARLVVRAGAEGNAPRADVQVSGSH